MLAAIDHLQIIPAALTYLKLAGRQLVASPLQPQVSRPTKPRRGPLCAQGTVPSPARRSASDLSLEGEVLDVFPYTSPASVRGG